MSRRKLTRRQKWRIEKIQQEKRERARRREQQQTAAEGGLGPERPGLVVTHYGQRVEVESTDGERRLCHFRANLAQLVVGDRVIWQPPVEGDGEGVVVALERRETVLRRPDPYGNLKPVAANVNRMLVVFAPVPTPSTVLLDRYLVAAELSDIEPVLLLNKADLIDDELRPLMDDLTSLYRRIGYTVLEASAESATGMTSLRKTLSDHTSVLVGQSGVGKSSLVNVLLPDARLQTAQLSDRSGLGQHTTTTARLFHLPEGGDLIDSPGIREFGLWHIDEEELLRGYRDLREFAGHCRFRNCTHRHEPGCALHEAVENGDLDAERLDNFFRIADSLDDEGRDRYKD